MRGTKTLWETIDEVAKAEGVELFDVDFPGDSSRGGVVRVYITKSPCREVSGGDEGVPDENGKSRNGVQFDDCVRVCKRLLDIDEQEAFIPDTCTLEVSSPGINRRLRLPQHFVGAVGERVRVKFRNLTTNTNQVVLGTLRSVTSDLLEIQSEEGSGIVTCDMSEIKDARVDFKF
jgi:ribosome maturation factor RimP